MVEKDNNIQSLSVEDKQGVLSKLKNFFEAFHRYDAYLERCRYKGARNITRARVFLIQDNQSVFVPLLKVYNEYFYSKVPNSVRRMENQGIFYDEGSQDEMKQQNLLWGNFQHSQPSSLDSLTMKDLKQHCEEFKNYLMGRRKVLFRAGVGDFVGAAFLCLGGALFSGGVIAGIVWLALFSSVSPFGPFIVFGMLGAAAIAGCCFWGTFRVGCVGSFEVASASHLSAIEAAVGDLVEEITKVETKIASQSSEESPVEIRAKNETGLRRGYLFKLGIRHASPATGSQPIPSEEAKASSRSGSPTPPIITRVRMVLAVGLELTTC